MLRCLKSRFCSQLLSAVLVVCATQPLALRSQSANLLQDPDLRTLAGGPPASAWTPWQPEWPGAQMTIRRVADGARCEAPGRPYAVGGLKQSIGGIRSGQAYAVGVVARIEALPDPYQCLTVRLAWTRKGELVHPAGILARGPVVRGAEARFSDVLVAPDDVDGANLVLEVRWPREGRVTWEAASLVATNPPASRRVKVGTVYLRPANSTPSANLDRWCEQVDAAGKLGLDLLCLSEAIALPGTRASASEVAEPIPGPSTARLGSAAARNRLWLGAGLMERDGDRLYNTAVLLNRNGELVGTYRKIHLPREEWQKGIAPGDSYPVFDTEFGKIAVQICYDVFFPEAVEAFARRGAEIILAPTWGDTLADRDGTVAGETLFRVRARDNGVYLVPSVYDGNSLVIDPMGRILVSSAGRTGVFWAEVDLNQREPLWWVGHWRSIGPRDRMPQTYQGLTERGDPP
jgi:predicted amidohydrolase